MIPKDYFNAFKFIHIGEAHVEGKIVEVKTKLFDYIYTKDIEVLFEAPYGMNYKFYQIFTERDSIHVPLSILTQNGHNQRLLTNIYNHKIKVRAIDILYQDYFFMDDILEVYNKHSLSENINKDLTLFKNLKPISFPHKKSSIKKIDKFLNSIGNNKKEHFKVLQDDSIFISGFYSSLLALKNAYIEFSSKEYHNFTEAREGFMFECVKNEIKNNKRILCFNGILHTNSNENAIWIAKGVKTLASRIKPMYKDGEYCNIYLLNTKNDYIFKYNFPNEYKKIKENTSIDKTYFLEINKEDKDFSNLSKSFTHLIIFHE